MRLLVDLMLEWERERDRVNKDDAKAWERDAKQNYYLAIFSI